MPSRCITTDTLVAPYCQILSLWVQRSLRTQWTHTHACALKKSNFYLYYYRRLLKPLSCFLNCYIPKQLCNFVVQYDIIIMKTMNGNLIKLNSPFTFRNVTFANDSSFAEQ